MATYDIDGIKYEIADGVDLVSTVSAIRALPSHKQPDKDPNPIVQFGKDFLGTGAALGEMVFALPALGGAATAAIGDIPDVIRGDKRMTEVIEQTFESIDRSLLPFGQTDVAQNPGYQKVGETFEMPGKGYAEIARTFGNEALAQTIEENFNPALYASMMSAGLRGKPAPKVGSLASYRAFEKAVRKGQIGPIGLKNITPPEEVSRRNAERLLAEKVYESAEMPADLFKDEPIPVDPSARNPYLLPEQERTRIEADIRNELELAERQGSRQGNIFETPMENLERRTSQPTKSAREGEIKDFIPQDREGNVPGVYPELAERGIFESQEARIDTPLTTIEPGFPLGRKQKGVKEKSNFITPEQLFNRDLARLGDEFGVDRLRDEAKVKNLGVDPKTSPGEFVTDNTWRNPELIKTQLSEQSVRSQLEAIQVHSKIPFYQLLASRINTIPGLRPGFILEYSPEFSKTWGTDTAKANGLYAPATNTIGLKSRFIGVEATLLHEASHAAQVAVMHGVERNIPIFEKFRPAVNRVNELYSQFKKDAVKSDKCLAK